MALEGPAQLRRQTIILIASLVALAISASLAIRSFMNILSSETSVKVKHSCIKINNSTAVITFTLSSAREGKYYYAISCNSSKTPFNYFNDGNMWAGGTFVYTLYLEIDPKTGETIAINVKIWWEDRLIDNVTHYVKAEER